jgi:hypothetical protein
MINLQNKWMNDPDVLAQIGHVLGGYAVVITAAMFTQAWPGWALAMIVYAAIKEFWYDANYEIPKQSWQDNLTDFSMYCAGVGLGLFVSALATGVLW